MEIDLQDIRDAKNMGQFPDIVEAARRHIKSGGTVSVNDGGMLRGEATTLEELKKLIS